MSEYYLGAINKATNEYENIFYVQKENKYKCISCDKDLILRKGQKKFQSFIHKNGYPCDYFKNATQTQIHSDAKMFLRWLIANNQVDFFSTCEVCSIYCKIDLPVFDQTKSLVIDHGVGEEVMDLVYIGQDNKIICGFHIFIDDLTKEAKYEFYQIHIPRINRIINKNFATQKIELITMKRTKCPNCVKYNKFLK